MSFCTLKERFHLVCPGVSIPQATKPVATVIAEDVLVALGVFYRFYPGVLSVVCSPSKKYEAVHEAHRIIVLENGKAVRECL